MSAKNIRWSTRTAEIITACEHNPAANKSEVFLRRGRERQAAGHTDFRSVVFPVAVKTGSISDDLNFSGATFRRRVVFEKADIKNLNFSEAYFTEISNSFLRIRTCHGKINLDRSNIEGKVFFYGIKPNERFFTNQVKALSLKDARIEKPHWMNFRSIKCFHITSLMLTRANSSFTIVNGETRKEAILI